MEMSGGVVPSVPCHDVTPTICSVVLPVLPPNLSLSPDVRLEFVLPTPVLAEPVKMILSDPRNSKWFGGGEGWELEETTRRMEEWMESWYEPEGDRHCFTWIVLVNTYVVGVVQVKKMYRPGHEMDGEWFVTLVLGPAWHYRGFGPRVAYLASKSAQNLAEVRGKRILAVPSRGNFAAQRCVLKAGFVQTRVLTTIGKKKFSCSVYVFPMDPAVPTAGETRGSITTATKSETKGGGARGEASRTPSCAAAAGD